MQGRSDLSKLLTMRHKFQAAAKAEERAQEPAKAEAALSDEAAIERELDEAMARMERERKRAAKKERELKAKSDLRQKMSVIATTTGIDNDEELNLNRRLWAQVHETGFEGIGLADSEDNGLSSDSDSDSEEAAGGAGRAASGEESEESVDERAARIDAMAAEMEASLRQQKEYQMQVDRRVQRSEIKKKLLVEQQRLRASDESEVEQLDNRALMGAGVARAGLDVESSGESSCGEAAAAAKFVNPLARARKTIDAAGELSEGSWSDEDEEGGAGGRAKRGREKRGKLGKRRGRDSDEDVVQNFF